MNKKEAKLISEMEETLKAFGTMLMNLNKDDNLVLGGSYSLILHGIKTIRPPGDVDIILYKATPRQVNLLKILGDFNQIDNPDFDPHYDDIVFKFKTKKNGKEYTLDILLEDGPMSDKLLWYKSGKIIVRVQDIAKLVMAKASYKRNKDFLDLMDLKRLNFNV